VNFQTTLESFNDASHMTSGRAAISRSIFDEVDRIDSIGDKIDQVEHVQPLMTKSTVDFVAAIGD